MVVGQFFMFGLFLVFALTRPDAQKKVDPVVLSEPGYGRFGRNF